MSREGELRRNGREFEGTDAGETAKASETHTKGMSNTTRATHFERFERQKF
jgi:hypothetical protein